MKRDTIVYESELESLRTFIKPEYLAQFNYALGKQDQIIKLFSIADLHEFLTYQNRDTKEQIIRSINNFGFYFNKIQLTNISPEIQVLFIRMW